MPAGNDPQTDLRSENSALRRQLAEQTRRIAELERSDKAKDELIRRRDGRIRDLLERIEKLERAGKRQAAPFSKGPPKPDPKPPGRKPGKAYGTHARGRVPQQANETVPVPLPDKCPHCGGRVHETSVEEQYQTDIPPVTPQVRRFEIHVGKCKRCGKRIQPRHPLQTSDALHAAGVTWGPNLIAHGVHLNKFGGLSWEKIAAFLADAFSLQASRSSLCRAMMRLAGKLRPTYETMAAALPDQPVIHADETGWRESGRPRWLWAFAAPNFTVYTIADNRGGDVVRAMLTADFAGLLGRDGWSAYNCLDLAVHQTCLTHLLRRCNDLLQIAPGRAAEYPSAVKALLKDSLSLRDEREKLSPDDFADRRQDIEQRMDDLLDRRPTWEPNRKLADHLCREEHALLTFLYFVVVEAVNWPGEHAMRFAVILRKMCGGNRSPAGSRAQETLISIERTCRQQMLPVIPIYVDAQHAKEPSKLHLTGPPLPSFDRIDHRVFRRPAAPARPCARR